MISCNQRKVGYPKLNLNLTDPGKPYLKRTANKINTNQTLIKKFTLN